MTRISQVLVGSLVFVAWLGGLPSHGLAAADVVLARVGAANISTADVATVIEKVLGKQPLRTGELAEIQAETLRELIDRALVASRLDRDKFLPDEMPWESRWSKWVAARVTAVQMERHFQANRREFDGTQLRVSHVLLKIAGSGNAAARRSTIGQADDLRSRIVGGQLTFAEAARRHSAGPSREQDGALGLIGRRGPMVESFSRAAFTLKPGEISPPVVTSFGVHLIRCDGEEPGQLTWQEARDELRAALAREAFKQLASEERSRTKIEWTPDGERMEAAGRK